MSKKILSILLSMCILFGVLTVLPISASAQDTDIAETGMDDYPYRGGAIDVADDWNMLTRECTSFCAWRLNNNNGVAFHNYYGGEQWGNAGNWISAAQSIGITVDNNPAIGSIACWTGGKYGHVAWVSGVDGDSVYIEEYNYNYAYNYGTRTINRYNPSGYIHIKDIAPDNEKPKVNNKYLSLVTNDSFRVCVDATDNIGISKVQIATWTQSDQSDLIWKTANDNGAGTFFVDNQRSDYANSFVYYNHIYIYDYAGNYTVAVIDMDYSNYGEDIDTEKPTVLEKYISNVTMSSFRICIVPNDNKGIKQVRIATWTKDDQSDVIWRNASFNGYETFFVDINRSDYSDSLYYCSHAYIYDNAGNYCVCSIDMDYHDDTPPSIEEKYISEISDNSFRVCVVPKDFFGIKQVRIATWTRDDQSDLNLKTANYNGSGTYYIDINRSDYADSTVYYNRAYVFDTSDNCTEVDIVMDYNPKSRILGDIDGDEDVGAVDVTYIQRYDAMFDVPFSEEAMMKGDVDGSSDIEIVDATYIQRWLAEMSVPYRIGEAIS